MAYSNHEDSEPEETLNNQNIAVVGGSAAGLFASILLARKGFRTRVIERLEPIEPGERTLIVTHKMRSILGPVADRTIVNKINKFEIFTDGRSATIPLKQPDLIVERRTLIQALASEAQGVGVSVEAGSRFHSLQPNSRGLVMEVERCASGQREELHVDAVIGGDGVASRVARAAGWTAPSTAPLVQALVSLPKDMSSDTTRVWFVPEDTPYFYWLIPESPTRGALGVIGTTGPETRRRLEQFLEKRGLEPIEFQGARVPIYGGWVPVERKLGQASVYLVGDAAAQVKVTTVGGTVTGFRGAMGVVECIVNRGRSAELRTLRRELDVHLLLRRSLHHFKQSDYSRLVDLLTDSSKQPLWEHSRDEAWKILWRVCLRQPRLILMGLRGLLMQDRGSQAARP